MRGRRQVHTASGTELIRMLASSGLRIFTTAQARERASSVGLSSSYLPEALRNYLARLSWSHGDDEIMSTEQMIEWFDIDDVGRSASRFDFAKLENLNGHYMRAATDDEIAAIAHRHPVFLLTAPEAV